MKDNDDDALARSLALGLRQEPLDLARWSLWADRRPLYAVVCAHGAPAAATALDGSGERQRAVLLPGNAAEAMVGATPLVVEFTRGGRALRRFLEAVAGTPWGMFARSSASFDAVHEHVAALHHDERARGGEGETLFEPGRVMRAAGALTGEAREAYFGPVAAWLVGPAPNGSFQMLVT